MSGQNTVNAGEEGSVSVAAEIARINAATAPQPGEPTTEEAKPAVLETVEEATEEAVEEAAGEVAVETTEEAVEEDAVEATVEATEEAVEEVAGEAAGGVVEEEQLEQAEDVIMKGHNFSAVSRLLEDSLEKPDLLASLAEFIQQGPTGSMQGLFTLNNAVNDLIAQLSGGQTADLAAVEAGAETEVVAEESLEKPAEEVAESETPAEEAPVEEVAESETPAEEAPVEEVAESETPAEEAPAEAVAESATTAEEASEVVAEAAPEASAEVVEPPTSPLTFSVQGNAAAAGEAVVVEEEEKAEVEPANDPGATADPAPALGM